MAAPLARRACGIDFGTSNSTAACPEGSQVRLLSLEDTHVTLPSVVFFNAEDNQTRYGRAGLSDYLAGHEGRLMRALKSLLGSRLLDGHTEVQGRMLKFHELLSHFIGELLRRAEQQAGRPLDQVVLGRPVHFVDDDPEADQRAEDTLAAIARQVGFAEVSFQFEPIAAAFQYETQLSEEALVLVVDIGGGTSDFSVIRLGPTRRKHSDRESDVLANAGVHIGGTDYDRQLSLHSAMPLLGYRSRLKRGLEMPSNIYFSLATWHLINQAYTRQVLTEQRELARETVNPEMHARLLRLLEARDGHWLANSVETGKIALSSQEVAIQALDRLEEGLELSITRDDLLAATASLSSAVAATIGTVLKQANVKAQEIDTVLFTGGASSMRALREEILSHLPGVSVAECDPFGSIGAGLAIEAARRYG